MVLTDETFLAFTLVAFVVALLSLLALFLKILSGARRSPLALGLLPILCAAAFQLIFVSGPHYVENRICHARAPLPERYEALVGSVVPVPRDFAAADLHSDALMWMRRDLLSRGTAGHVDLPRLEEGRFKLQVFSMVISAPRGINLQSNMRPHFLLEDHVFPKMILERWPIRSWNSHLQRALVQCERLHKLSTDSAGRLLVALTATDVDRPGIQGVLALEGATSLESNVQNLDLLYKAGLRVLGPTHFFDTEVGGSQSGIMKGGLTLLGREVVSRMKSLGMIVDLAHASEKVIEDMAQIPDADRPCTFLSHTGVRSVCASARNYGDAHLKMVADMGGIVGIALFYPALCNREDLVQSWVESVRYAVDLVGVERVALGSDFDGAVVTSVHAGQTTLLYSALVHDGGFTSEEALKVIGQNTIGFFRKCLPQRSVIM